MATTESARLIKLIHEKAGAFIDTCKGIDENTASLAPEGRWTPKQIVSHLTGPEGVGMLGSIRPFLAQESPKIDIEPENPFYSPKRAGMTMAQLVIEMTEEYGRVAELVAGLTDEQLARKANIPLLKDSPMGEYLTLAMWIQAIAEYHIGFHIDHMKEIVKELGKA
jgi:hypothetical protein